MRLVILRRRDGDGVARRVLIELEVAGEAFCGTASIRRRRLVFLPCDVAVVVVIVLTLIVRHGERHLHESCGGDVRIEHIAGA